MAASEMEIGLSYQADIPEQYFAEFVADVRATGTNLQTEARENEPYQALEWVIPTAVAIYIGKPFIDTIIKRAADDFGDAVYPKIKSAVQRFVQRIFIKQPLSIKVISTAEHKVANPDSVIFSIYAAGKCKGLKFVFNERLTEDHYLTCIDALFAQLADHHNADGTDSITEQIATLENPRSHEVYLIYNKLLGTWSIVDPMVMARALHARQKAAREAR